VCVSSKDVTPRKKTTILVVEDDGDAREALSEFLQVNGYLVASAENGRAALDKIGALPPNLILLDLMMPVMDGFSFLDLARRDYLLKDIPIIVTTGHPSESPPGATAVVGKPVKPEKLLSLVRRFAQGH
jgi:CheY-like chemotaxis protein